MNPSKTERLEYIKVRHIGDELIRLYFELIEPERTEAEIEHVRDEISYQKLQWRLDLHFGVTYLLNKNLNRILKVY